VPKVSVAVITLNEAAHLRAALESVAWADERIVVDSRSTDDTVAIAGAQTAVYPLDTPGGWHIIGRTETVMFDPQRDPPALLRAGDTVRFVPA